jgi:uncharacterized membrane protein SpoIIM required for sporulation
VNTNEFVVLVASVWWLVACFVCYRFGWLRGSLRELRDMERRLRDRQEPPR